MSNSLRHIGLGLTCETCDGEIELPDDLEAGTGICRQCGIAFLVDAPYERGQASRRSA
jgi:hypothetical protein